MQTAGPDHDGTGRSGEGVRCTWIGRLVVLLGDSFAKLSLSIKRLIRVPISVPRPAQSLIHGTWVPALRERPTSSAPYHNCADQPA